jgi:hypothetical protein
MRRLLVSYRVFRGRENWQPPFGPALKVITRFPPLGAAWLALMSMREPWARTYARFVRLGGAARPVPPT